MGKKGVSYNRTVMIDYIRTKWGVRIPGHKDFQFAKPFKHPWNDCEILHTDSWVLDWERRDCVSGKTWGFCRVSSSILPILRHKTNGSRPAVQPPNACTYDKEEVPWYPLETNPPVRTPQGALLRDQRREP